MKRKERKQFKYVYEFMGLARQNGSECLIKLHASVITKS